MSKVAIAGNASGTGTFTIAAPNSNTDRTLTLPDEAGTVLTSVSDLPAANLTGSLPAGMGGKVLQLVSATSTVNVSASGTRQTLLTVSITPSSASNKVFISFSGEIRAYPTSNAYWDVLLRNETTTTDLLYNFGGNGNAASAADIASFIHVDSPSSTSSVTYSVGINRGSSGTNYVETDSQRYTLVAMEIAA